MTLMLVTACVIASVAVGLAIWSLLRTQPVSLGGTGSTTAEGARSALGLSSLAVASVVPVSQGGTGATAAEAARSALGLKALATQDGVTVAQGGTGYTSTQQWMAVLGKVEVIRGTAVMGLEGSPEGLVFPMGVSSSYMLQDPATASTAFLLPVGPRGAIVSNLRVYASGSNEEQTLTLTLYTGSGVGHMAASEVTVVLPLAVDQTSGHSGATAVSVAAGTFVAVHLHVSVVTGVDFSFQFEVAPTA